MKPRLVRGRRRDFVQLKCCYTLDSICCCYLSPGPPARLLVCVRDIVPEQPRVAANLGHCALSSVQYELNSMAPFKICLYDDYSTGGAFDSPTQNTITSVIMLACLYKCIAHMDFVKISPSKNRTLATGHCAHFIKDGSDHRGLSRRYDQHCDHFFTNARGSSSNWLKRMRVSRRIK